MSSLRNRVASYRPLEAASDEEALETAKQIVDRHDVEVWLLDREIGRLNRTDRAGSSR
jgi:hypothetical protein